MTNDRFTRKRIEDCAPGDLLDVGTFDGIDPRGAGQGPNTVNVRLANGLHYTESAGAMVRVHNALPAANAAIDVLAVLTNAVAEDERGAVEAYELVVLMADQYAEAGRTAEAHAVRLAFDLCPVHACDQEICADDRRAKCRIWWDKALAGLPHARQARQAVAEAMHGGSDEVQA